MRFFCLIATEDRLWNMKKAFRMLQQQYGDAIQGSCYSLWDVCQKPDAYAAMMEEARGCQYAIVYFHGGAQILPDLDVYKRQSEERPDFKPHRTEDWRDSALR